MRPISAELLPLERKWIHVAQQELGKRIKNISKQLENKQEIYNEI